MNSILRHRRADICNLLRKKYSGLTGGQVVYQKLIENNVNHVWISTGGAVMPLVDAFYNGKIKYFLSSHEQFAGHAATGFARSTGKPGISIVTSGPGFTNSLTALTDSMNDSTPFILLSGQVPLNSMGTNAFQECPSVDISKPVTKWSICVDDAEDLPLVIDEAFKVSTSGKPGSVHIDLPKCVTSTKLVNPKNKDYNKYNSNLKKNISKEKLLQLSKLIHDSKNPVILVGQGCNDSFELLREFSIKSNIPVTTTIHAMGCFDETHELSLEFLGMHGNPTANYAIQNSDLIIALGTRFDDRITGNIKKFAPKCFESYEKGTGGIIHVNVNDLEINSVIKSHYNFNMDCEDFLENIIPYTKYNERKDWTLQINSWKKSYPFKFKPLESKIKTQQVIIGINDYLLNNNISNYFITTGVGNHQMMASQFIKWKYPKSFISSGSLGTMGVGLPFAIGCQIGNPNSLVIDIDGDGSFNHSLNELKTINNYNLPIKIAIMNDSKLSMVKAWEKLFYNENYTATDLGKNPDYVKLAESFNIKGLRCDNINDLSSTIETFLTYSGPILCDFRVEEDLCLPLVAPGQSLDNMILDDKNDEINNIGKSNLMPPG